MNRGEDGKELAGMVMVMEAVNQYVRNRTRGKGGGPLTSLDVVMESGS